MEGVVQRGRVDTDIIKANWLMETALTSDALQAKEPTAATGSGGPIKYLGLAAVLIIAVSLLLQLLSGGGEEQQGTTPPLSLYTLYIIIAAF